MLDGDGIFAAAEAAVKSHVLKVDGRLEGRWRGVKPIDCGIGGDDWLKLSERMIESFNSSTGLNIAISAAGRAPYRKRRMSNFVVAIANLGDRAARKFVRDFKSAGW